VKDKAVVGESSPTPIPRPYQKSPNICIAFYPNLNNLRLIAD
jgi:hypothetical protein